MSHSYNRIWLHVVFSTKNRYHLITPKVEQRIYSHMREQLIENGCPVRIINGMPDHVHLLFLQNPKKAVIDLIKQVKGNTSHWINEQNLIDDKFGWQTGYAAYSVSESQKERVFNYIRNQKKHHAKKSFVEEYKAFVSAHSLIYR